MTGQPTTTERAQSNHHPHWRAAPAAALDWRFIGTDPLDRIASRRHTALAKATPANENAGPRSWGDWAISIVLTALLTLLMCAAAAALIAALYVTKSALGIDLFSGHSFLHHWFYAR